MENAAKALLIAGGVLISILVISFLVYFRSDLTADAERIYTIMSQSEISSFNQPYLVYDFRDDLTIQDVVSIINLAINNNQRDYTVEDIKVTLNGTNYENKTSEEIRSLLENGATNIQQSIYSCRVYTSSETGLVNQIAITENED